MKYFLDWRQHAGATAEKFYKSTLWQGEHVMVGLNCLEPNQTQSVHAHEGADKFYFVVEGEGKFTIGHEERIAAAGALVLAPAGIAHGVENTSGERLSLLVARAPVNFSRRPACATALGRCVARARSHASPCWNRSA